MRRDNDKCDVFKTAKRMDKTNQDIICEQCIKMMAELLGFTGRLDGDGISGKGKKQIPSS